MKIIGFSLNKISGEKKKEIEGKHNITTNLDIKDIEKQIDNACENCLKNNSNNSENNKKIAEKKLQILMDKVHQDFKDLLDASADAKTMEDYMNKAQVMLRVALPVPPGRFLLSMQERGSSQP